MDGEIPGMKWNVLVPGNLGCARPTGRISGITAGVIVGLGLLTAGIWFWSAAQEQRGNTAYGATLVRVRQADSPEATPEAKTAAMAELERVLAEYPSHPMAAQAAYGLANLRFGVGQYDKARSAWQIAIAKSGGATIATLARAGIGYSWEAERKLPEATQT